MHAGRCPVLTPRPLGQKTGLEQNPLNILTMPAHNHTLQVSIPVRGDDGTPPDVDGNLLANAQGGEQIYGPSADVETYGGGPISVSTGMTGNSLGINNIAPYQTVNYIIALQGTYPSRS